MRSRCFTWFPFGWF